MLLGADDVSVTGVLYSFVRKTIERPAPPVQFSSEMTDTKEGELVKGQKLTIEPISTAALIGRSTWKAKTHFGTGEIF